LQRHDRRDDGTADCANKSGEPKAEKSEAGHVDAHEAGRKRVLRAGGKRLAQHRTRHQQPDADDDDHSKGGDPQSLGRDQNAEEIDRLLA
jgi:hypothetical protein